MCLLPDAFYSALKKSGFCGTKPALFVFSSILYMTGTGKSIRRYYLFEQILYLFLYVSGSRREATLNRLQKYRFFHFGIVPSL
jgi:hypothetical protein